MTFPWWAFSGRLWFDEKGYLRYAVNFGDPVTARKVRKRIKLGSQRGGQIVATGKRVPDLLRHTCAPWSVWSEAKRYVALSPARDDPAMLKTAQNRLTQAAAQTVRAWCDGTGFPDENDPVWKEEVRRAIAAGELLRPACCDKCGRRGKTHAHHYRGYGIDDWLEVQFLCPPCHGVAHRRN